MADVHLATFNADISGLDEPSGDVCDTVGPAICVRCEHLYLAHKSDAWWKFLCIASPRRPVYNAVVGTEIADPPYYRCKDVNAHGDCKLYREGVNDYCPKPFPER